jgi:hypothetical protein
MSHQTNPPSSDGLDHGSPIVQRVLALRRRLGALPPISAARARALATGFPHHWFFPKLERGEASAVSPPQEKVDKL